MYIMEGQQEGNDFKLYDIVARMKETEYGYLSATEMASITYDASKYGLFTLWIEQDKDFKLSSLSEIEVKKLQVFLSQFYDNDRSINLLSKTIKSGFNQSIDKRFLKQYQVTI